MNAVVSLMRVQMEQIKCQGRQLYLIIGIALFMMATPTTFGTGFGLILYTALYFGEYAAEQSKSVYLLSSLPVERKQVVQARYLYALAALTVFFILLSLAGGLLLFLRVPLLSMEMLPTLFLSGCLYIALVLPPMLIWGGMVARFWALGGYVLITVANTAAMEFIEGIHHASGTFGAGWPLIVGCALLLVSYLIALTLYRRKQIMD